VSALSVLDSETGMMIGCADPIYITSAIDYRTGAEITFEVLEADASSLEQRLGKRDEYGFDPSHPPFFAVLTSLDSCQSTHPALALLRDRPTMRGVLRVSGVSTVDGTAELV